MNKKLKILLITGKVSREHNYRLINEMLRTLLESTGRFEVKITEEFHGATDRTLEGYDGILINYDGKHDQMDPTDVFDESSMNTILNFVSKGKGAMLFHSSCILDNTWPDEYHKMAGGYVDMTAGSRKNPKSDSIVYTVANDNPISKGAAKAWMAVEDDFFAGVFWHPQARAQVLAYVPETIDEYVNVPGFADRYQPVNKDTSKLEKMPMIGEDIPVMWTNLYGDGRVFCTTLGHSDGTIKRVNYLTMFVRGMEWAATGEVTLDFPDRAGEKRIRPWPFYAADEYM